MSFSRWCWTFYLSATVLKGSLWKCQAQYLVHKEVKKFLHKEYFIGMKMAPAILRAVSTHASDVLSNIHFQIDSRK